MANLAENYAGTKVDLTGYPLAKELITVSELKKNEDIVITQPDKGNGVVVLNKSDYVDKMSTVLEDEEKFHWIWDADTYDRTIQQEWALQAFLLADQSENSRPHHKQGVQSNQTVGTTRPQMYGLPKLHKDGVPLQPILSMIGAPQHELAELLKLVVNNYSNHTIKDTFEFCSRLESIQDNEESTEGFMCCFDIKSLFANIPLEKTIDVCLDCLYRDDEIDKPTVLENKTSCGNF